MRSHTSRNCLTRFLMSLSKRIYRSEKSGKMFRDRNNSRLETEPSAKDHEDLLPPGEPEPELPGETTQSQTETKASEPRSGEGDPRDQVVRLQAERDALFDRLA